MSHPRGVVAFVSDGKSYELKLNTNAIADLQEAFGGPSKLTEVLQSMATEPSVRDMRTIFKHCLRWQHPYVTDEEAGDIMDGCENGMTGAAILLVKCILASRPRSTDVNGSPQMPSPSTTQIGSAP